MANATCPRCRQSNVRRSHRQFLDFVLRSIGMVPLRCNVCEHRFFRFRKRLGLRNTESQRTVR